MIKITGWDDAFEDAHSRKRDKLYWFQVPADTESTGLLALRKLGLPGLAAFGVFNLLCQLHASTPKKGPRREGILCRSNGKPLSNEMIADKLRIDEPDFSQAIAILSSEDIGWIEHDLPQSASEMPSSASEMPRDATEMPRDDRHIHTDHTKQDHTKQTNNKPKRKSKAKGTAEEIETYCVEVGLPAGQGQILFDKWEGNGWANGKAQIKDWKATVRTWKGRKILPFFEPPGDAKTNLHKEKSERFGF